MSINYKENKKNTSKKTAGLMVMHSRDQGLSGSPGSIPGWGSPDSKFFGIIKSTSINR